MLTYVNIPSWLFRAHAHMCCQQTAEVKKQATQCMLKIARGLQMPRCPTHTV